MVLFLVLIFVLSFSLLYRILTPLAMDEFGWSGEQATLYNGIVLLASGATAVVTFMVVKVLSKK